MCSSVCTHSALRTCSPLRIPKHLRLEVCQQYSHSGFVMQHYVNTKQSNIPEKWGRAWGSYMLNVGSVDSKKHGGSRHMQVNQWTVQLEGWLSSFLSLFRHVMCCSREKTGKEDNTKQKIRNACFSVSLQRAGLNIQHLHHALMCIYESTTS